MPKYRSTYTSGGKQTSTSNQVVDFYSSVYPFNNTNAQFLHFVTFDQECRIKLNDESTIHWIDKNSEFVISDIQIDKFTIVDGNVQYYWTALSE